MPNLFEHLTSAPSIFIFGRRPKGSEAQPNFCACMQALKIVLSCEKNKEEEEKSQETTLFFHSQP